MSKRRDYQIVRVSLNPNGDGRWGVMRTGRNGPDELISKHDSLAAARRAVAQLLRPVDEPDLPDPNPELFNVTYDIKWY